MNGLQLIDLEKATFMDKLLRREPRENAFVEINNLLAVVPIFKLDRESIDKHLEKYNVEHEKARSRLLNFYAIILHHFMQDKGLELSEIERLHHLKYIFTLDDKEVSSVHRNAVQPVYKMHIRRAVSDGELTEDEKIELQKIAVNLSIPKEYAKKLYVSEATKYLNSVLKNSIADGMLSDAEEAELEEIAQNLRVELKFSENAKKNLDRCRYLWRLYQGELPPQRKFVYQNKKVSSLASVNAVLYQVYNQKVSVKYSGYHEQQGQDDYGFHSGAFNDEKIIDKVIRFIDQGTLFFTDHMLLFKGTNGDKKFQFKNITGGSFYQNGFVIELKRGNDRFFKFDGDMEELKLIFDTLMTKSRK